MEERKLISIAPPKGLELQNYLQYFKDFEIKVLKEDDQVEGALILTGGPDIGLNQKRDSQELNWIQQALEKNLPILGICRGMQLLNVFFKGEVTSLSDILAEEHRMNEAFKDDEDHLLYESQFHLVEDITNLKQFVVNSRHHQYCSKVAENFKVTHYNFSKLPLDVSIIPEAFVDYKRNILGVQWHPERQDYTEALDYNTYPLNWLKQQIDGKKSN
jgi:gamma-glutamyl-gamma-aminobutyrate hydrolase PuuD